MIIYLSDCNGNLETAIRRLNRRIMREGTFEELKRRRFFEKPSDKKRRKMRDSIYRSKKKKVNYDG